MKAHKDCGTPQWMTKNRERHYGYKNQVNADAAMKPIITFTTSAASFHDSQAIEELIDRTDKRLFVDSAYASKN